MRRWCNRSKKSVHIIGIYEMSNISGTPTFLRNFAIPLPRRHSLSSSPTSPLLHFWCRSPSQTSASSVGKGGRGEGTFTAGTESNALPLSPLFPHLWRHSGLRTPIPFKAPMSDFKSDKILPFDSPHFSPLFLYHKDVSISKFVSIWICDLLGCKLELSKPGDSKFQCECNFLNFSPPFNFYSLPHSMLASSLPLLPWSYPPWLSFIAETSSVEIGKKKSEEEVIGSVCIPGLPLNLWSTVPQL